MNKDNDITEGPPPPAPKPEFFSDSVGRNIIKVLENVGSGLTKIGETVGTTTDEQAKDINVTEVITNSLSSTVVEKDVSIDESMFPPPPPEVASLDGLVDKYNELLKNLDNDSEVTLKEDNVDHSSGPVPSVAVPPGGDPEATKKTSESVDTSNETPSNHLNTGHVSVSTGSTKSVPDRQWLSADMQPERQEGEDVEEAPVAPFTLPIPVPSPQMILTPAQMTNADEEEEEEEEEEWEDEDEEDEDEEEDDDDDDDDSQVKIRRKRQGGQHMDDEDEVEDEWEDDNDLGYVTVTISEREFFEMEEDCARRLALSEQLRASCREAAGRDRSSSAPPLVSNNNSSGSMTNLADRGTDYESDLAAAEESLRQMANVAVGHGSTGQQPSHGPVSISQPTSATKNKATVSLTSDQKRRAIEQLRENRSKDILGQQRFFGVDGMHSVFNLKIIFEPYKTGFEETKHFKPVKGTIVAGRFRVSEILGQAAFSTALQCEDLEPGEFGPQWVCLKVIKNNKDFFDQSLDEIKLLQYINSMGDADRHNVLKLVDYFYCKEHLFIVCELLRENLYDFGKYIRDNDEQPYFTFPRLKSIIRQVLEALRFIHSLGLIHCDIKPENIVIKSYSRCEVKLIDFGSSCFVTDHLTSYIQSRSYRAPEVILGLPYDFKIDIWSVGAVLAEMHTGYVLFQNDSVATMLARISGILGPMPASMIKNGREAAKFYTVAGIPYDRSEAGDFALIYPKRTSLQTRLHLPPPGIPLSKDEENFQDIVRWMLEILPDKRPYATDALTHDW
eukprot:CAMPEP_0182419856 /NCGR_PEP_ID=MMETSP1167-20130531/4210_1 /TAXON_ID=2988 /ORGANISM="Mallomonas Sp, Strain CCMP3275" /LENGTH=785 /DNA_ID=CAMNT_0024594991 /DNA_START=38 /DNA_END=2392 /DNA_ORIENTATION=-